MEISVQELIKTTDRGFKVTSIQEQMYNRDVLHVFAFIHNFLVATLVPRIR